MVEVKCSNFVRHVVKVCEMYNREIRDQRLKQVTGDEKDFVFQIVSFHIHMSSVR